MNITAGIHHITTVGSDFGRALAFYGGVLGLRLLHKAAASDDATILDAYFGDAAGSPGSLITVFVRPNAPKGRHGIGQVSALCFSIAAGTREGWHHRLRAHGVHVTGRAMVFGEQHLCFTDPDGLDLALVEDAGSDGLHAIGRIRSVELQLSARDDASRFLAGTLGLVACRPEGPLQRFSGGAVAIDVLRTPDQRRGSPGTGVAQHIAWRVVDEAALRRVAAELAAQGSDVTPVRDGPFFQTVHVEGPGGIPLAFATDGPGFPAAS